MSDPFLLVQLSDPHVGADWGGDPAAELAGAVEAVLALRPAPGGVLLSGDLADHAADREYEQVRALLARIPAPLHVLPGNHDGRAALRRHFELPGAGDEPVQYATRVGPLRLVALDSTRPGEDRGELDDARLAWLDAELAADTSTPTVVALHHPPLVTGIPALDEMGLPPADRLALARVVERHPQVHRLVAGHLHRTIAGDLGGRTVVVAPSTFMQLRLDFRATRISLASEPAGFAVHAFAGGELLSHVQPVGTGG